MNETIVMIHGMWGGEWVWGNYRSFFESRGYRCITPSLRFHERNAAEISYDRLGRTSLLDYARDLEEEICRLDQKPIIMGHSMGGLLAQILGSRGMAKALVLLTPASPSGIVALRLSVIKSFWSALTRPGFWKKPMLQTFDEATYSMLQLIPAEERKGLYEKFVPESGRAGFEIGFWVLDARRASRVDEARITCPTLVIAGEQDKITPPGVVRSIADKYRAVSTFKEFAHHAHWVHDEPGWKEIAEYSSDWLERVLMKMPQRPQPPTIRTLGPGDRAKRVISGYRDKLMPADRKERRTGTRTEVNLSIEANIPCSGNAQYYEIGRSRNIGSGGLFMETDLSLDEGAYVNANINTGKDLRPLWIQGRVVRSSSEGIAMAFTHAETERLNRLIPT
jgi:pimeloyl-ACP methyl ester carboxylesterase